MVRLGAAVGLGLLAGALGAMAATAQAVYPGGLRESSAQPRPIQLDRLRLDPLLAQAPVQTGRRSALVIGNGAYTDRLANAVNDAEAVARTLQEIGFSVTLVRNADKRRIDEEVEAFSRRLGQGDIGLFYFSGHGVQVDGENYLVPINAQLSRQADAQYEAVPLGKVMNAVETTRASAKIIILDACRNNPFYRRWPSTARGGATRGLAMPQASGEGGTLIAFSTAPGKEAADGIGNSLHSPFTTHLLRHLRTPNLEVGQLFRKVRGGVKDATRNGQIPWVSEALIGEVYLNPTSAGTELAGQLPDRRPDATSPELNLAPSAQAPEPPPTVPPPAPLAARESSGSATTPSTPRDLSYALQGHTGSVRSVSFSPDGRRIVSGSMDNTLRLWDAATGKPIGSPLQGHTEPVSVAFSPDGRRIVSGSMDNTLRLWDAVTGKPIGSPLQGHTNSVWSVAFSPDGRRIVSGSEDNTLRLWDAVTGKPIGSPLQGRTGSVFSVAFSPDGRRIVSGSEDNTLRLWDAATGKPIGSPLQGHTEPVISVAFSPDGLRIVSGSEDNTLRLWDAVTGKPIGSPLQGHRSVVISVAFSPDGRRIVSGSGDNTLRLWDAATGKPIGSPLQGHTGWVVSVAFSPDGRRIVSGSWDNTLRLWDEETGAPIGFAP
jgi:DNA-binding beta-propeller fold protein YncE